MTVRTHWLEPLLAPRSIALVGGSPRPGSVGNLMVKSLLAGGYPGSLAVVNPRHSVVEGIEAVASLADLSGPVDLAILSVAAHRMEGIMREAIRAGARALVIFDACLLDDDREPRLLGRLKAMAREAGVPVCGGNGMGFYNFDARTFASFQEPLDTRPGHIAALCHSGSVFGLLANESRRMRFNLLVSQGQEINASIADYMDYALEQPTTRVLALFAEAIRDPDAFVRALVRARDRDIPVVVTKVGRTPESARLAQTHSGALVGDDRAFDAVCRRYGALRTDDLDGLMAAAQILGLEKTVGEGGFAAILDSGGLREQMIDLASDIGVEFAPLSRATVSALEMCLDIGLEAVNPLDAAGRYNERLGAVIGQCAGILERDPGVAILAHEYYRTDRNEGLPEIGETARQIGRDSKKPYILTNSLGAADNGSFASAMLDCGVPVINGMKPLLTGVRCALAYRDRHTIGDDAVEAVDPDLVRIWKERLSRGDGPGEAEVLSMLGAFDIPVAANRFCRSPEEAAAAARAIGYPVALKTAVPGLLHKSDSGGVHLDLQDDAAVRRTATSLMSLGPEMCVAEMVRGETEVAFGMVNDPQWGPVVMVGAGGTLVELLDDRTSSLAPFGALEARRLIEGLRIRRLLDGVRSRPPCDIALLSAALSRFSAVCHALKDVIVEIDVNPLIVGEDFVKAVDAVLIPRKTVERHDGLGPPQESAARPAPVLTA
ncbi:MAG: acetate--CoA ligase family protein [bacterium]|nr:acetate--CoA ligase family protein [bacterium]MDE0242749.1 acetate--CoA ligase family protein [bacterium]MDE0417886.1 acetate--CoA ligase family protein [bacterium]